jgi:hypothetical protein
MQSFFLLFNRYLTDRAKGEKLWATPLLLRSPLISQ